MQIKKRKLLFSTILAASFFSGMVGCVSAQQGHDNSQVFNEPIVFEDKIVFLKPVVFKSGVEFRGPVQGGVAALHGAGSANNSRFPNPVRLKSVERKASVARTDETLEPLRRPVPRQNEVAPDSAKRLSVLTYNVKMWNYHEGRWRVPHVTRLLRKERPDVVALQECGSWFFRTLTRQAWFRKNYYVARPGGRARHVGGLALFSRYPIESVEYRVLPRSKGRLRYALVARLRVGDKAVSIANVHLESPLAAGPLRRQQMEAMLPMIEADPDTILLGDFNFGDGEPEEAVVRPFTDVWTELRGTEAGHTWDREKSWMARRFSYRGEQSRRLDRILLRSDQWRPESVKLFGNRRIPVRNGHFFASDHFGVLTDLVVD